MLPQIILIIMHLLSLGITIGKHGQEKTGKEDARYTFVALIISWALLYWGGFFDVLFQ